MNTVAIREFRPAVDRNFVVKNWIRSSYGACPQARLMDQRLYFRCKRRAVLKVLHQATTLLAVDREAPEVLYGQITGELSDGFLVIHFVYVKSSFRQFGIARKLIAALARELGYHGEHPIIATQWHEKIPKAQDVVYNPYWEAP